MSSLKNIYRSSSAALRNIVKNPFLKAAAKDFATVFIPGFSEGYQMYQQGKIAATEIKEAIQNPQKVMDDIRDKFNYYAQDPSRVVEDFGVEFIEQGIKLLPETVQAAIRAGKINPQTLKDIWANRDYYKKSPELLIDQYGEELIGSIAPDIYQLYLSANELRKEARRIQLQNQNSTGRPKLPVRNGGSLNSKLQRPPRKSYDEYSY